jgi:hypothetical protein
VPATVAHLAEPPDQRGQLEVLIAGPDGRATARLSAADAQPDGRRVVIIEPAA